MITLHFNNTQKDIKANDSSYRYRALMSKPQLVLKFALSEYIEFPIGTWCEYQNERYTLNQSQNIKKNGTRNIEYTLTMGGDEDLLGIYKMRNTIDHRLKWSMCAKPSEFIEEIVKNLNAKMGDGVWSVGKCIEANEKTVEFNHAYIDAALQDVAKAFETEWEIVNHTISLHKVEYFKDNPLPLAYGKGNGFIPGVGRTTASNEQPIKRLYVQGGDRNIDRSKYGASELLLPKSQTLDYERRTYQSDADGLYIERIDKASDAVKEDSLDCAETYPSRIGNVTDIVAINRDKNFYDIIDNTIPESLNYNDYLIAGENMTIIFQSGMLAGKEFELKYKHAERRFEIVPQEIDGITMPNDTWKPKIGDTYAIFGCMLPNAYICDNESKTGASWDMFKQAAKYLYEHEEQKFTFKGTLQGLYAKRNWVNISGYLKVGGYIRFTDEQFAKGGVDIRITGIKDYINTPHSPTLEISNSVSGKSVSSQLREIDNQEVVLENTKRNLIQYTKRRFRDAKETIDMLNSSLLDFSTSVNPVTIQTMAALVGDESLQFRFVRSKEDLSVVDLPISYDTAKKQLIVSEAVFLQHMTLGINSISSSHANTEYKVWELNAFTSAVLDEPMKKYYLYAKVGRNAANVGIFLLSETAIDMETDADSYYFLVGILNSEVDGERSFVSLYGFTEVLPGRITTDKIVSSDGKNFLDLLNNTLHLGDDENYLDWNNQEVATLLMSNATIKNALKVLGEALIAGFYFSDTKIRSSMMVGDNPALTIDGVNGKIHLKSSRTGAGMGDYAKGMNTDLGSTIEIDAQTGEVEVRNDKGVSYVTANGIFSNHAMTNAMPVSTGYTHYGSIVGLGFGNINKTWEWDKESSIIAGVYGRADNEGNALAYGGYFWDLLAAGLIYRTKYVSDKDMNKPYQIGTGVTQVVGLTNSGKTATVILPSDGMEGKVIYIKQIGSGALKITTKSGQKLYDDNSANDYYDVRCGEELKLTFAKYDINNVITEVWLTSKWRF